MKKTQYQNYKSDFALRESFLDITGKPVPLPDDIDFTLRYWVRDGHEYEASRVDGVYHNCAPEGDSLLVFFKDHGLCEGALHHELHLPLDNEAFGGTQNVYYPAEINVLLWDKSSSGGQLTSGVMAAYTRGKPFEFSDFTQEQIEQLQQPAREAAEQYGAALADYEQQAGDQVQRMREAADGMAELATEFSQTSTELLGDMQQATGAAQQAVADAERRTEQAVSDAAAATAEARQAKADADAAAERARSAKAAAEQAATAAEQARAAADAAAARAEQAQIDTGAAAEAARLATTDANNAAHDAEAAAGDAHAAIQNCDSVVNDARGAIERADAMAEAARLAKEAAATATAAANAATTAANTAAAAARQAKKDADAATAAATAAAERAEAAAQHTEQERALLAVLIERAKQVVAGAPTGLRVETPQPVTIGNPVKQHVRATVLPVDAAQNLLYLADGKAVDVLPDGEIVCKAAGTSTVHVIPTDGTRYYKTIQVTAVPPRMRLAGGIRLDRQGHIRLT